MRSRLLVPALGCWLGLCLRKPAVVDQRVGFFLDGSSGPVWFSPNSRPTREGSLLRRTWRGISVEEREGREGEGRGKEGEKEGYVDTGRGERG